MRLLARKRPLAWNGYWITQLSVILALGAGLLLIRLSPLEGAALVVLLAVVIGTLLEPMVGLVVALFLGPLKAYLSAEVPQIPAQIGHAFVALALVSWFLSGLSRRSIRLNERSSPLLLALVGFVGAVLLSLWDAIGLAAYGIPELIKWIEILVLFLFVKEHLTADGLLFPLSDSTNEESYKVSYRLWGLVAALFGSGVFQALVGLWQFGLRDDGPEHFRILGGDFFRAYGTFEQPNPYAGYLGLTAALAVGTVAALVWDRLAGERDKVIGGQAQASEQTRKLPAALPRFSPQLTLGLLASGAALIMLAALVASWSRGAWIGFVAAVLAMAAALPLRIVWRVLLVTALVVGGGALYLSDQLPAPLVTRLTAFVKDVRLEDVRGVPINDANYAVVERLAHWQAAISMFRWNLWTGVGFGCYEAAYPAFALINWPIALGHAHNIYLNLAAETGLLGLTAYLVLWAVAFWQTWRVTRRAQGVIRGLAVGLIGVWTHLTVHHLLDNLYVNNVHLHIGVMLGLATFLVYQTDRTISIYDR